MSEEQTLAEAGKEDDNYWTDKEWGPDDDVAGPNGDDNDTD